MVKKEDRTKTYYNGMNQFLCASHWVDPYGEEKKIPQGLKLYYQYRKSMHDSFAFNDSIYYEKHTTVAKVLGLSVDTIKRVYNPMLKNMGLIETKGSFSDNNVSYVVYDLDNLNGYLVNYKLKECKLKQKEYKKNDNFNYNNLKILEHNKLVAKNIRTESDQKLTSISTDRLRELMRIEKEYNKDE